MKRTIKCLSAFVVTLGLVSTVGAGVKDQFKCEQASQLELPKALAKVGKCISDCVYDREIKGNSGRVCVSGSTFDPITRACADKEEAKYLSKLAAKCKTTKLDKVKMPQCGGYAANYPSLLNQGNGELSTNVPLVEDVTESLFICDQTDAATITCEAGVVKALGRLSADVAKCLSKCYQRKQTKGETTISCDPNALGLDAATDGCIAAAKQKSNSTMVSKCVSCNAATDICLPNCGMYASLGRNPDTMNTFVTNQQYAPFAEDDPDLSPTNPYCGPRVCGDNVADPAAGGTQGEQCDGTDDSACPGLCQADCTCP